MKDSKGSDLKIGDAIIATDWTNRVNHFGYIESFTPHMIYMSSEFHAHVKGHCRLVSPRTVRRVMHVMP